MKPPHLATVVVTYNRRRLLEKCLVALNQQSRKPDSLFVVDNASTDDTVAWLKEWLPIHAPHVIPVYLSDNTGGAGGFAEGMRLALDHGADWIWMMDDDAEPKPGALQALLEISDNEANIYGSLAVNGKDTAWATTLADEGNRTVNLASEVPTCARVQSLPFLGFMIHRSLVNSIGPPDAGFFIAADDVEYCMRAKATGAKIYIAGKSLIEHPKSDRYVAKLPFRSLICLRLPAWKRYYDTRNRLLIARRYHGLGLLTQTIPGSFVRLFASLLYEPNKLAQMWSFAAGMIDGIRGRKGRRHEKWGIKV